MKTFDTEKSKEEIPVTIFVVEDNEGLNRLIQKNLQREGLRTSGVFNGSDALTKVAENPNVILLLDYILPDMTGKEIIGKLTEWSCNVPFIIMTGHGDEKIAVEMMKLGARDYIAKDPDFLDVLPLVVKRTCEDLEKEKKLAETSAELLRSERKYKYLFDNSPTINIIIGMDGLIKDINESAITALGYSKNDIIGRHALEFVVSEQREQMAVQLEKDFKGEYTPEIDIGIYAKDKSIHTILFSPGQVVLHEDGQPNSILVTGVDITERKRTEQAMIEAKKFTESIISNAMDGIVVIDLLGNFIQFNDAFLRMTEYSNEELKKMNFRQITPEKWRVKDAAQFKKLLLEGESLANYEKELVRKDGSVFPVMLSMSLLYAKKDEPFAIVAIIRDETERKRVEEALLRGKKEWETTFDAMSDWVCLVDVEDMQILRSNVAGETISGLLIDKIIGQMCCKLLHGSEKQVPECPLLKMLHSHERESMELQLSEDGRCYLVTVDPIVDDNGNIITAVHIVHDITERKQAEEKLKQTMEELARSNEELEQFAHVASHDLQEPLRMVASYTQLLQKCYKDKLDKDAHEFIEYAVEGATRMQSLINGLLSYSRIGTRGKEFAPANFEEILEKVIKNLHVLIEENDAKVTYDSLPTVMADDLQMIQVFQNLISNSIKFRSKEPPRVYIFARRNKNEWIFSVRDNGIGIDLQYKERIFMIFQRLHGRMKYPGVGVGLTICKKVVDRHRGKIWVESKPNKGSTFYFSIPVRSKE